ncbi:MAG: UDP-N-acetylmuramate dehydrogenase [Clostridia bacterium]|nr:UDP-N-acetylmuramate dehydrogenase [Clostridia bacterium]
MLDVISKLRTKLSESGIKTSINETLAAHSTFRIGGPAAIMVFPSGREQIINVLRLVRETGLKYTVIGNGSNILFDDSGYAGVIISTVDMRGMEFIDDTRLQADCGASFISMSLAAARAGLSGLEFAYGIPGSCGGAVFMNAGAYGSEVSSVVDRVYCYDVERDMEVCIPAEELEFSYRHSLFMDRRELIILSATFILNTDDTERIKARMDENMRCRREKQPLEYPNAGSVFKRHEKYFIGKLIDDCGLKGYSIGGAQISEKHAGFIVNRGGATSADVLSLVSHIKNILFKNYGFEPECEIRYIH